MKRTVLIIFVFTAFLVFAGPAKANPADCTAGGTIPGGYCGPDPADPTVRYDIATNCLIQAGNCNLEDWVPVTRHCDSGTCSYDEPTCTAWRCENNTCVQGGCHSHCCVIPGNNPPPPPPPAGDCTFDCEPNNPSKECIPNISCATGWACRDTGCPPPGGGGCNPTCNTTNNPDIVGITVGGPSTNVTTSYNSLSCGTFQYVGYTMDNPAVASLSNSADSSAPYQTSVSPVAYGNTNLRAKVWVDDGSSNVVACEATTLVTVCDVPAAPAGVSCFINNQGTLAGINWTGISNPFDYPIRVRENGFGTNCTAGDPNEMYLCEPEDNGSVTSSPYIFNTNPGNNYAGWMHSRNICGSWSASSGFNCNPVTGTLSYNCNAASACTANTIYDLRVTNIPTNGDFGYVTFFLNLYDTNPVDVQMMGFLGAPTWQSGTWNGYWVKRQYASGGHSPPTVSFTWDDTRLIGGNNRTLSEMIDFALNNLPTGYSIQLGANIGINGIQDDWTTAVDIPMINRSYDAALPNSCSACSECTVNLTPNGTSASPFFIPLNDTSQFWATVNPLNGNIDRVRFTSSNSPAAPVNPASVSTAPFITQVTGAGPVGQQSTITAWVDMDGIPNVCFDDEVVEISTNPPWLQAVGADLSSGTGDIDVDVPTGVACTSPPCYLIEGNKAITASFPNGYPGIANSGVSIVNPPVSSISSTRWNSQNDIYSGVIPSYTYFDDKIASQVPVTNVYASSTWIDYAFVMANATTFPGTSYKVIRLHSNGDVVIRGQFNLGDEKLIIFAKPGTSTTIVSLDHDVRININDGVGFFALFAEYNLTLSQLLGHSILAGNIDDLEGIFFVDGTMFVPSTNNPATESRLQIRGAVYADSVDFRRDLLDNSIPAERFVFGEDLLANFPPFLGSSEITWREAAP